MPARAAAESAAGGASTGFWPGTPATYEPVNTSTASNRLASGPAATIAMRLNTLWRLNARERSAAATLPSRSSSIFT